MCLVCNNDDDNDDNNDYYYLVNDPFLQKHKCRTSQSCHIVII